MIHVQSITMQKTWQIVHSILWTMTGRSETNSAFNSFRVILLEPLRGPNGGPVKHDITLQATF